MSTNYEVFLAAEKNDISKLKYYIEDKGVDVNLADYDRKATPLHWAANRGNLEAIEYLIDQGANVNAQNKRGRTPLHSLVEMKYDKVVLWLVKYCGADPYIEDVRGSSPFDLALNWFKEEITDAYENRVEVSEDEDSESSSEEEVVQQNSSTTSTSGVSASVFKFFLPNSTYKSILVEPVYSAEKICEILSEKLGFPEKYGRYIVLYERVVKENRRIYAGENIIQASKHWPLIFGETGNETHLHCYFIAIPTSSAPEELKKAMT